MMRSQAWEPAKGEMRSMLVTFVSPANASEGQFEKLEESIRNFVEQVEMNGLHE